MKQSEVWALLGVGIVLLIIPGMPKLIGGFVVGVALSKFGKSVPDCETCRAWGEGKCPLCDEEDHEVLCIDCWASWHACPDNAEWMKTRGL